MPSWKEWNISRMILVRSGRRSWACTMTSASLICLSMSYCLRKMQERWLQERWQITKQMKGSFSWSSWVDSASKTVSKSVPLKTRSFNLRNQLIDNLNLERWMNDWLVDRNEHISRYLKKVFSESERRALYRFDQPSHEQLPDLWSEPGIFLKLAIQGKS